MSGKQPFDKKSLELTQADLGGFALNDLKCRACSGYGNCGYRMYRLYEGKVVSLCQLRRKQLLGDDKDAGR